MKMQLSHYYFCICISFGVLSNCLSVRNGDYIIKHSNFSQLAGHKIGLITDHIAIVDYVHIIDWMHFAPESNIELTTLFGPEHGIRGTSDAGKPVSNSVDERTGLPVYSLYGNVSAPTTEMLKYVTALVYDLQDVGARFYTYLSTLGLSMQSAAKKGIPFFVLDRPNPIGATDKHAAGWVLESGYRSFIGLYPIPIAHALTVGELALMIKGEGWLDGLQNLDLRIIKMEGYTRGTIFDSTNIPWISPSPNIVDLESAFAYPGTGFFEAFDKATEGRGTLQPFKWVGAPWVDSLELVTKLNSYKLPGVVWHPTSFIPQNISGMSTTPKFLHQLVNGVRLEITDYEAFLPVDTGVYLVSTFYNLASPSLKPLLFNSASLAMHTGNSRLISFLQNGTPPDQIVLDWKDGLSRYLEIRKRYLLYN